MIKVSSLSQTFQQAGKNIEVLKSINLSVEKNRSVAIVGPSGSGKSTLLNIIAGILQPSGGIVEIEEQDLFQLSPAKRDDLRLKKYGFIFQQFHLLPHLTVEENVAFPLLLKKEEVGERVYKILKEVKLEHRLDHFPEQLSGGEKQRVAIARALVGKPRVILADEPSGSLDEESGEKVSQIFFEQVNKSGASLILVTHNVELAKHCDEVFTMYKGELLPYAN